MRLVQRLKDRGAIAALGRISRTREFFVFCSLVCLGFGLSLLSDQFLTAKNFSNVLLQVSATSICAVGMTMVLLTGGIDVSVGSILAVVCTVVGRLGLAGVSPALAVAAGIVTGACFGLVNGVLVASCRIPAIIATLGTMNLGRAVTYQILAGKWISTVPPSIRRLGLSRFLFLPTPTCIGLALAAGFGWFLSTRRTGRYVYAIGGNRENALLSGVRVELVQLWVYVLAGAITALAAVTYFGRTGLVQTNTGIGFEIDAIAAAVLGGTRVGGGRGTVWGSILGAVLVGTIKNGLILANVPALLEGVVIGGLIIIAVVMDTSVRGGEHRA